MSVDAGTLDAPPILMGQGDEGRQPPRGLRVQQKHNERKVFTKDEVITDKCC